MHTNNLECGITFLNTSRFSQIQRASPWCKTRDMLFIFFDTNQLPFQLSLRLVRVGHGHDFVIVSDNLLLLPNPESLSSARARLNSSENSG